jgi:hypothetical protein
MEAPTTERIPRMLRTTSSSMSEKPVGTFEVLSIKTPRQKFSGKIHKNF